MIDEKVNILVMEDEGVVALSLENALRTQGYQVAGIVDNGPDALQILKQHPVDLALLDIHVKGAWDGVQTAHMLLAERHIPFIFLTAFSDPETVSRARDTSPSAYLVKPYQPENLFIAIDLAMHNYDRKRTASIPWPVEQREPEIFEPKEELLVFNESVFIKQGYTYVKTPPQSISYLEVSGNHTWIFSGDKKYVVRAGLQSILEKLGAGIFVRVHRSFAINIRKVTSFNAGSVCIGDTEIPVSRSFRDDFFAVLKRN